MNATFKMASAVILSMTLVSVPYLVWAGETRGGAFVRSESPLADVLAVAKQDGKPVLMEFSRATCRWCERLDKDVLSQRAVADALKGFVAVAYDGEVGEGREVAANFHIAAFPTVVIADADGAEIGRIEGFRPTSEFVTELDRIRRHPWVADSRAIAAVGVSSPSR